MLLIFNLVHAFVMSWVDYCNVIFAGAPKSTTKLQRVMNAAARVVSGSWKYDRGLTQLLHVELRPGSDLRFLNSTHLKVFQLTFRLSRNLFFSTHFKIL